MFDDGETRTVFVRANGDGVGGGPVAHAGPGQHPDAVLGPAPQLVQHEGRLVEFDDGGLAVPAARLHAQQLVVGDAAVRALGGRRRPRHAHGGGRHGRRRHVHRRRARHYKLSDLDRPGPRTRPASPATQIRRAPRVALYLYRPNRRNH